MERSATNCKQRAGKCSSRMHMAADTKASPNDDSVLLKAWLGRQNCREGLRCEGPHSTVDDDSDPTSQCGWTTESWAEGSRGSCRTEGPLERGEHTRAGFAPRRIIVRWLGGGH
ncbi:MAG: hypothetical protein FWD57_07530 [Polyangiaceae bacterium]|nr:hypothetical protein [Polyangiaceae bacterium]